MRTTKSKIRSGRMLAILVLALGLIASVADADFTFGDPTNLGPIVNSESADEAPSISADGLSLYFGSWRPGGHGNNDDLWVSTRPTAEDEWGEPENLGSTVNTSAREGGPRISADGLSLYFNSTRPGGYEPTLWGDVWVTERATTSDPWGDPVNLGPIINSPSHAFAVSISHDNLSLFFGSDRAGGSGNEDLWVATRATTDDLWEEPVNLGTTVNGPTHDADPSISADGLALFFSDYALAPYRPGGYGNADLWMTTRPTVSGSWGRPVNLGPTINTSDHDFAPSISADGSTLYFMSDRPGTDGLWDLWQASVVPIIDFNGNGTVGIEELVILIESWGRADPRCDVGPMPWGDGNVDAADLEVLMGCWGQPVDDPTLLAHWPLDETEGMIAPDIAGGHDGTVTGLPVWRPAGGQIGGAAQFDGSTCVTADFVLSPADGPFSVLAWVKGGAPAQVIVSQEDGLNWLMADPTMGALMTELKCGGRCAKVTKALGSDAIITDGAWHRVGVAWDGTSRRLYADDVLVAEDPQDGLADSTGGLILGCGKSMTPDTCWTGLIDDVRIYNRAVEP